MENIKVLEKKEKKEAIKISLSKVTIRSPKDTLFFNTLDWEELTINLNFILKTPAAF